MFSKVTSYIRQTAMTGLLVASIGGGLLFSTVAAHAGPLDGVADAANAVTLSDAGGSHIPPTCTFDGQTYQGGETRTTDGVSFYCMPSGIWVTIDPPGPPQQTKGPRQLKGVVSLVK